MTYPTYSHLGKRKLIDSKVPWEVILVSSQEGNRYVVLHKKWKTPVEQLQFDEETPREWLALYDLQ